MSATDKRTSELTDPVLIDDTDFLTGYRPGTSGNPNLDIRAQVQKIRAPILGGLATGAVPVAARQVGALGTDTTLLPLADELDARGIDVRRFGARPDGSDCVAAVRLGDAYCAANGKELIYPPGDWTFSSPYSGTAAPYTPIRASWRGAGEKLTRFVLMHSPSYVPFRVGTPAGLANYSRAQSRSQASPYNPVYAIDDVPPGQGWVHLSTVGALAGASELAVGDLVHVAGGKNVQDADGNIWYYDQLHRIQRLDTANDKVYFDDCIDYYLTSQGWDGAGAGKNLATDYANATAYTAGQYVWYGYLLYKALTSGTSNNASIAADTGVTWTQVSAAVATTEKGVGDWRPVMQKAYSDAVQGLSYKDFTIDWRSTAGSTMWALGGAYGCTHERISFLGGTVYPVEATRHILFWRCQLPRGGIDGTNNGRNAISTYNARKIKFDTCVLGGGNTSTVSVGNRAVKIEGHAEIILENCDFSFADFTAPQCYLGLIDRGDIVIRGGNLRGFREPVRFNVAAMAEEVRPYTAEVQNSRIHLTAKAFRHSLDEDLPLRFYGPSNSYLIKDGYSSGSYIQADNFDFRPTRYERIIWSITPAANQSQVVAAIPDAVAAALGITNLDNVSMIFLGAEALWTTPTANSITIRFQAKQVGDTGTRNLLSAADSASHRLVVNSTTVRDKKTKGDLTSYRDLQAGIDRLQAIYSSGATAGGALYFIAHVLL